MEPVVTLEPWSPWPLLIPATVVALSVAASIIGARRRNKPLREAGYVGILIAGLAIGAMAWSLAGIWDTQQRTEALVEHGFERPTFGGVMNPTANTAGLIEFQAVRDGEHVRGNLVSLGGDRWLIRELER